MLRRLSIALVVLNAAAVSAPGAHAAARKSWPMPLQGSSTGNFGLLRGDYRFGKHAHAHRPTAKISPAWSQPGTYAVAVLKHPPKHRSVVFSFTANQLNPPPSQSAALIRFKTPVSESNVGAPMALTLHFDTSRVCRHLPKGPLKASSFSVLASGGDPLGTLSSADQIAQGLDIVCGRSGGNPLRVALAG